MKKLMPYTVFALVLLASSAHASQKSGSARTLDGRPSFNFSLADLPQLPSPKSHVLFDRVLAKFTILRDGDGTLLKGIMTPGAQFRMVKSVVAPGGLLRAIRDNCTEPFEFDEGSDWVQISWVCDHSPGTTLSAFKTFEDSPELTMTIWFEGNLISDVFIMEPVPVPTHRLIAFGAYREWMGKK